MLSTLAALLITLPLLTGAADEKPRLGFEGLGAVHIGMSEDELIALGFSDLYRSSDWQNDEEYAACHYLSNEDDYPGADFMINDGKLVRIGIDDNEKGIVWQTVSGAMIGMSEVQVAAIYGKWMTIDGHPYLGDAGSYLVLQSANGRYKMILETAVKDDGDGFVASGPSQRPNAQKFVTRFRAGLTDPVGFIEGCS